MGAFTTVPQQQGSPAPAGSPQGAPPSDGAPTAAPAGDQQGNPLQSALMQMMEAAKKIGSMNEIVSPDMNDVISALRKAFVKTVQTPNQPPQQAQTPSAF